MRHQKHKQLPAEVKVQIQDITGRAVSQVKFNMIQTINIVLWKFTLVLPITLPPNALCFFTLDAVGSHLHVADRSICTCDQDSSEFTTTMWLAIIL